MNSIVLEEMIAFLEQHGAFRVLRRLAPWRAPTSDPEGPTRHGLVVDVETTGLDQEHDEVIEIAAVPFVYTLQGSVVSVGEPFEALQEPSIQVDPHITRLTGISQAMLTGHSIDVVALTDIVSRTDLVISHNSSFDRPFCERLTPAFAGVPWACTCTQIPWREAGFGGTKLAYLAVDHGFFFDPHRASADCLALLELLRRPFRDTGSTTLAVLLEAARRPSCRIHAIGAPFEAKALLKARGYRWSDGSQGPRAWHIEIDEAQLETELRYLREAIYCDPNIEPLVVRLTALDRFSRRR